MLFFKNPAILTENSPPPTLAVMSGNKKTGMKPYRIMNAFFDCLLAVAVMYVLSTAFSMITSRPGGEILMNIEAAGIISFLSFGTVLFLRRSYLAIKLPSLFSAPGPKGQIIFFMAVTAAGLGIVLSQIDNMLRPILKNEVYYQIIDSMYSSPGIISVLIIGILAPMIEELFFRGYIFTRLRLSIPKPAAIIAASLLFGIFHLNTPQMIAGFFTGLILCYLTEASGGILYAVLFHGMFNTFPFILLGLNIEVQGYTDTGPGVSQPLWFTLTGFLLTAAGIYLLAHILRNMRGSEDTGEHRIQDE